MSFTKALSKENAIVGPLGLSKIELDLTDPASFDLGAYWNNTDSDRGLIFACKPSCPAGVNLSSNGLLEWSPASYHGSKPYRFEIWVRKTSSFLEAQIFKLTLIIDQFAYRAGRQWKRYESSAPEFKALPKSVRNFRYITGVQTIRSRARSLGSVTYLGFFKNEHLIVTNFHVYAALRDSLSNPLSTRIAPCDRQRVFYFKALDNFAYCKELLFSDPILDLAVMSISPLYPAIPLPLRQYAPHIRFDLSKSQSSPLVVAGHGRYKNLKGNLSFGFDSDCYLDATSPQNFSVAKLLAGFGTKLIKPFLGPSSKQVAPRLAIACDVSPGDSGGPVIHYKTGELLGITVGGYQGRQIANMPNRGGIKTLSKPRAEGIQKASARALFIPLGELAGKLNYF